MFGSIDGDDLISHIDGQGGKECNRAEAGLWRCRTDMRKPFWLSPGKSKRVPVESRACPLKIPTGVRDESFISTPPVSQFRVTEALLTQLISMMFFSIARGSIRASFSPRTIFVLVITESSETLFGRPLNEISLTVKIEDQAKR